MWTCSGRVCGGGSNQEPQRKSCALTSRSRCRTQLLGLSPEACNLSHNSDTPSPFTPPPKKRARIFDIVGKTVASYYDRGEEVF